MAVTWTTQRTGNWSLASSNASSPWYDGGTQTGYARTPGSSSNSNNDLVRIADGHTLTCDASVTCGDATTPSTNAIACTSSAGTGILSVSGGVTLTVVSNVVQANATWTFAAGSGLTFNSSTALTWQIGAANNQSSSKLALSGSSGSRITVQSTGSANGYFTNGSFTSAGKIDAQYVDYIKIGVVGGTNFHTCYPSGSGADLYSWQFCTWDANCGGWGRSAALTANCIFRIEDCTHNGTGQLFPTNLSSTTAIGTGTRSIRRCYFAGSAGTSASGGQWWSITFDKVVFAGGFYTLTSADAPWASAANLVIRQPVGSSPTILPASLDRSLGWSYLHAHSGSSQTNIRLLSPHQSRNQTIEGLILDPGNCDSTGDLITLNSPGSARSHVVQYCIALPNSSGARGGQFLSGLGNANIAVSVNHCTYLSDNDNGESGSISVGETYVGHAGMLGTVKSCLAWSATAAKATVYIRRGSGNTPLSDILAAGNCDYNGLWNPVTSGTVGVSGYKDYASTQTNPMFSTTSGLGAHDVTVTADPFVDRTRDIASFAVSKSLAVSGDTYNTKVDASYAYLKADPGSRIAEMVDWVKAGWKVVDATLNSAGHDGATIGALDYYSAPGSGSSVRRRYAGIVALMGSAARASRSRRR